ncbi:MAG TPA: DsbA family protein [Candidatus Binataceae bacterium]|nr:DsbA family protein [Candidatus Binataceae bacterium]
MAESAETIAFYYDFKSPFTYLAMEPAFRLEQTHRVRLRFVPLELPVREAYSGELEQRAPRDWDKVRYLYMDVRRFANERGITIRGPQKIFDSRLALMSGLYADRNGRFRPYAEIVFERFFKRELDIEDFDALAAVIAEVGLDAAGFRHYAGGDGPGDLRTAAAEAENDGVFGVPTFNIAGELFWGNDRVEWMIKKLDRMKLQRTRAA